MPALPDVANVIRARVLFTLAGKPTQGVRQFFRWSGTSPTSAALTTLAEDYYNALVGASIAGAFSNIYGLSSVELVDLSSEMGAEGVYAHRTTGTLTGTPLPVETAFVTEFGITRRYRGGHPKTFWPFGDSEKLQNPNTFTPSAVSDWQTVVTNGIAGFVGESSGGCTIGAHVCISYYKGFSVVTNPLTGRARNVPTLRTTPLVTNVTAIVGRERIGSQRRRREKV
jgi:hypothetical protein